MNRRDFTQLLLLVAASTRLASCQNNASSNASGSESEGGTETILVIGAGMAGISAARHLQDAGYPVIVLEGRDRLGGRVWTSRKWADTPLDMGASWIHGERGNPLTDLADKIGAPRQATDSDEWPLYDGAGNLLPEETWEDLEAFEAEIWDALAAAADLDQDISVEAAIAANLELDQLSKTERKQLDFTANLLLEQDWATDISQLSAYYADEGEGFSGDDVLLPQGYDSLVKYLATGLDIRFNETVTRITYTETGVSVLSSSGTFAADRAVVTLPLGVLKRGDVTFEPPLPPRKQQAIATIGVGVLNKLYLQFPTVFWQPSPDWISYISETKGEFSVWLNLYRSTGKPVLAAFNAGHFAQTLETFSDAQIINQAMQILRLMYGPQIPDPVDAQISRWASDPFARGSYSSPRVGMTDETRQDLADPVGDRLFFAGEATNSDYPATVHGAYLSGQREADRIRQRVEN